MPSYTSLDRALYTLGIAYIIVGLGIAMLRDVSPLTPASAVMIGGGLAVVSSKTVHKLVMIEG